MSIKQEQESFFTLQLGRSTTKVVYPCIVCLTSVCPVLDQSLTVHLPSLNFSYLRWFTVLPVHRSRIRFLTLPQLTVRKDGLSVLSLGCGIERRKWGYFQ